RTELDIDGGLLHEGLPELQPVWMSHGDAVTDAPEGFEVTGTTVGAPVAAFENRARRLAGVQYHPEVLHSPHGQQVLSRFLHEMAGIKPDWTPANIADAMIERVREQIGDAHAICALSGGVDSAVAGALVQRAIGDKLTCVFVDHGLPRAGERRRWGYRRWCVGSLRRLACGGKHRGRVNTRAHGKDGHRALAGRVPMRPADGLARTPLEQKCQVTPVNDPPGSICQKTLSTRE